MIPAGTILIAYLTVAIPAPVRPAIPTENWSHVESILTVFSAESLLISENEDEEDKKDDKDRVDRSESRRPSAREERNTDRQPNRRDRGPDGPDSHNPRSRDRDGGEARKPERSRGERSEKPDSDKDPDALHESSGPRIGDSPGKGHPPGFGFPMPFGMPRGFNFPRPEPDKSGPPALRSGPFAAGPGAGFQPPGRSPFGPIPPGASRPDQESAHPTGGGLSRVLFQLLDADRNGQLSIHEFQRLAEILEHAPGPPHDALRAETDRRPGAGPGHPPDMQRRGGPGPDRPSIARRGFPMMRPDHNRPKPPHQPDRRPDRGEEGRGSGEESQRRPERSQDDEPGRGPDQPRGDRRPSRPEQPSQSGVALPQDAQPVEIQIPKISGQWI
jgi:hypothetical protein